MKIAILILAAGASRRMKGRDKLLEEIEGCPLLVKIVQNGAASGCKVGVTLPDLTGPRARVLKEFSKVELIEVATASQGMSQSIVAGVSAFSDADALMILPADMPDITASDISEMVGFYAQVPKATILRATNDMGDAGHPVIFPHDLFADLANISGDQGAQSVVKRNKCRVMEFPLPGSHATTDLDTPEAWQTWRNLK